ncbi:glycosyltransferase family 2 protein [candidate division KSB1 bacterium]|nr:glycosyltransferase family 2 protein [candidate division KSB1 bacterium]
MKLSIIIVNYNTSGDLHACLASLENYESPDIEIIVIDNASKDDSVRMVRQNHPGVVLHPLRKNLGFSKANNLGSEQASGEFLVFLNPDTELCEPIFEKLLHVLAAHQDVGIIGPRLVFEDGTLQMSTGAFPGIWSELRMRRLSRKFDKQDKRLLRRLESRFNFTQEVDWVTGACMMLKKELFESIGRFDETIFMFFEDVDLCRRVHNAGLKILYFPEAKLIHKRGSSYAQRNAEIDKIYRQSQLTYYSKHNAFCSNLALKWYLKYIKRFNVKNES